MNIKHGFLRLAVMASALGGLAALEAAGCTTDKNDPGATGTAGTTGAAGTGAGGHAGTTGAGGTGTSATICAASYTIPAATPGIADFDAYDGSDISKWFSPLGNDTASNQYAGPFGYGDRANGFPETFNMVDGQASKYALHIADTLAMNYGGGMGAWLSTCLNATSFTGVTFWVKGTTPKGTATFTLQMGDTLPSTPAKAGDAIGTCSGTSTTCVHPTFAFPVTTAWTQVKIPWTSFTAGNAAGTTVKPDGRNITQFQVGVDLNWMPDAAGVYQPVPAPYDVTMDTLAFY
jgi:hypothetical protein